VDATVKQIMDMKRRYVFWLKNEVVRED